MATQDQHFDHATVRWAVMGAIGGVALVGIIAGAAIMLSGGGSDLIGVAALGAAFGGTGFGAMLGAVLGSLRQPALQTAPVRDHAGDAA